MLRIDLIESREQIILVTVPTSLRSHVCCSYLLIVACHRYCGSAVNNAASVLTQTLHVSLKTAYKPLLQRFNQIGYLPSKFSVFINILIYLADRNRRKILTIIRIKYVMDTWTITMIRCFQCQEGSFLRYFHAHLHHVPQAFIYSGMFLVYPLKKDNMRDLKQKCRHLFPSLLFLFQSWLLLNDHAQLW